MSIPIAAWIAFALLGIYALIVAAYRATTAWEWLMIVAYLVTLVGTVVYIKTGGL